MKYHKHKPKTYIVRKVEVPVEKIVERFVPHFLPPEQALLQLTSDEIEIAISVLTDMIDETHFSQSGEKQIMLAILNWLENEV